MFFYINVTLSRDSEWYGGYMGGKDTGGGGGGEREIFFNRDGGNSYRSVACTDI